MGSKVFGLYLCKTMNHCKNLLFCLFILIQSGVTRAEYKKGEQIPATCSNHCVTPYGEVIGVAQGNVYAYRSYAVELTNH
ncbi:hypothetical protein CCP3SC1AL1_820008 [Gammaproteobacteria bacterium]